MNGSGVRRVNAKARLGGLGGFAIEGAHGLADVATEEPVVHLRGQAGSMSTRCSIVRYEMHRRASMVYGAGNASVGQASRQRVQLPQWSVIGGSGRSGRSVRMTPRKKNEPAVSFKTSVFLPIQPMPAAAASSRSVMAGRIDAGPREEGRGDAGAHGGDGRIQFVANNAVVVLAPGVHGDAAGRGGRVCGRINR